MVSKVVLTRDSNLEGEEEEEASKQAQKKKKI